MFYKLSDDLIQCIIEFLNLYLEHNINYIKKKIISLEIYFLKQVNKLLNKNIELFFKNKLKTVFVISNKITNYYNNIIKTLYFNEIAKIGNIKMFNKFNNFNITEKYNEIINNGSKNGNINVLVWFKNSEFKYRYVITHALENKHKNILKWFKFEYIYISEWFKNYKFDNIDYVIKNASSNGHVHIIKWFKKLDLNLIVTQHIMRLKLNIFLF